jgi:hypothetical protein
MRIRRGLARSVRRGLPLTVAAVLLAAAGCTNASDTDLCSRVDNVSAKAQALRDSEPAKAKDGEVRAQVAALQAALDQLQAVSDGQLDQAISDVRSAAADAAESAVANGKDAAEATRGALQDALDNLDQKWVELGHLIKNQCSS